MTVADEIGKLNELRQQGVITAEEFEAQKARLLAGAPLPGAPAVQVDRRGRPIDPEKAAKARKYVIASHALGWGGIGVLFVVGPILIAAVNPPAGIVVMVLGLGCAITGGVLGQIGRAMQGRVM